MEVTLKLQQKDFRNLSRQKRNLFSKCRNSESQSDSIHPIVSSHVHLRELAVTPHTSSWNQSKYSSKFEQISEAAVKGLINIDFGDVKLAVRSSYLNKLHLSLEAHKGYLMDDVSKSKYYSTMSAFSHLGIKGCFAAYSTINRFVKTRLHLDKNIVLNTTFFEKRDSDIIAFSIEYDGEIILVGSANAMQIADRFKNFLESL